MATIGKEMMTTSTVNERLPKVEAAYLDNTLPKVARQPGSLSKDLNPLRSFHKPGSLARSGRTVGATGTDHAREYGPAAGLPEAIDGPASLLPPEDDE